MTHSIDQIGINAKEAASILAKTSADQKNHALQAMATVSYTHLTLPTKRIV